MLEVMNILSMLRYIHIVIPISVSIYKIISIVIYKVKKKDKKISSYGFSIAILLLILNYIFTEKITILFCVSLIALGVGLLIYNSFENFKEDMFVIPIFAYCIFCMFIGNKSDCILLSMLCAVVLIPDLIRIIRGTL